MRDREFAFKRAKHYGSPYVETSVQLERVSQSANPEKIILIKKK